MYDQAPTGIGVRTMRGALAVFLLVGTSAACADAAITFVCCAYTPTAATISVGESVSFSGAFSSHPLRQVDGPSSDTPTPGGFANSTGTFYAVQFNTPGTYYFQCFFHGIAQFGGTMRGSVQVLPVTPPADAIFQNGFE